MTMQHVMSGFTCRCVVTSLVMAAGAGLAALVWARRRRKRPVRVALLGYGAIGSEVGAAIVACTHGLTMGDVELVSVLIRSPRTDNVLCTTSIEDVLRSKPDIVIEAAGQQTVRDHAELILASGAHLLMTSIGALTDDALYEKLQRTAATHGSRLLLASGAMPALDWMHSSSLAEGDVTVMVEQRKSPAAWKGARVGGDELDFDKITQNTTVFEGSARKAASLFPKNSNVSAMLGLATCGLDSTQVKLVADVEGEHGTIVRYSGSAGAIEVVVHGKQSSTNPRTSAIVSLAVLKALKNLVSTVGIGI